MDAASLIVSLVSGGTVLALAGVVYAAGKHVRSLESIEDARRVEAGNLAQIPILATRMTMVETACASALNEARQTREQVVEIRAELRNARDERRPVVSALRPGRGPSGNDL